ACRSGSPFPGGPGGTPLPAGTSTARTVIAQAGPPPFRGSASIRAASGWRESRDPLHENRGRVERRQVVGGKKRKQFGEFRDPSRPRALEDPPALRGGADDHGTPVVRVSLAGREAVALQ